MVLFTQRVSETVPVLLVLVDEAPQEVTFLLSPPQPSLRPRRLCEVVVRLNSEETFANCTDQVGGQYTYTTRRVVKTSTVHK